MLRNDLRNIAIIAHVDHGKTTLVDAMLKQSGIFRANEHVEERVMDSNALERERGITILAKNTAVMHKDTKINILDTPGHADFGGEVERVLTMVDGVLLLVDAYEGPMPQTKYVLRKALEQHLKPIVVINKIDRPDQRVEEVIDEVLDLFIELGADDDQLEFPVVLTSARNGIAKLTMEEESDNLEALFKVILENIPAPDVEVDAPLQMLVNTLDYDDYVGRIVVGRVIRGTIHNGETITLMDEEGERKAKIGRLYTYEGLKRAETQEVGAGDIVALIGLADANIGDTIADAESPEKLKGISIDEPTLSMVFSVNNSPFAGREGEYVTSRHLRDRLFKEIKTNVSMRLEETESPDAFIVSGRGELHLSVLIETMRREGYELQVSPPHVLTKVIDGKTYEPMEHVVIDVPTQYQGAVMTGLGQRKAILQQMESLGTDRVRLEFRMPSRGLFGYRNQFLTDTHGEGVINQIFDGYDVWAGMIANRSTGSLVSFETGEAVTYGLFNAQQRGTLLVGAGEKVYEGMVIGYTASGEDVDVNVCKTKHLTNTRASGSDDALRLIPISKLSLEGCLEFLAQDELLEVTPENLRIRKQILNHEQRMKAKSKLK